VIMALGVATQEPEVPSGGEHDSVTLPSENQLNGSAGMATLLLPGTWQRLWHTDPVGLKLTEDVNNLSGCSLIHNMFWYTPSGWVRNGFSQQGGGCGFVTAVTSSSYTHPPGVPCYTGATHIGYSNVVQRTASGAIFNWAAPVSGSCLFAISVHQTHS
jgi:hypothetical protein